MQGPTPILTYACRHELGPTDFDQGQALFRDGARGLLVRPYQPGCWSRALVGALKLNNWLYGLAQDHGLVPVTELHRVATGLRRALVAAKAGPAGDVIAETDLQVRLAARVARHLPGGRALAQVQAAREVAWEAFEEQLRGELGDLRRVWAIQTRVRFGGDPATGIRALAALVALPGAAAQACDEPDSR